jgi:hypothetical protein
MLRLHMELNRCGYGKGQAKAAVAGGGSFVGASFDAYTRTNGPGGGTEAVNLLGRFTPRWGRRPGSKESNLAGQYRSPQGTNLMCGRPQKGTVALPLRS